MLFLKQKQTIKKHTPIFLPISLMVIVSFLHGMIDTYFVSLISDSAIAAVGLIQPLFLLIAIFLSTITNGASTPLSKAYGGSKYNLFKKKIFVTSSLNIFAAFVLFFIFYFFSNNIFSLFDNVEKLKSDFFDYYYFWVFMIFTIAISNVFSTIYNIIGKAKLGAKLMLSTTLLNIPLTYILMFGINGIIEPMGVMGTSLATLIASIIGIVLQIIFIKKENYFMFKLPFKHFVVILKRLMYYIAPALFQGTITPLGIFLLNILVSYYSVEQIAVFSLLIRFELLYLIIAIGAGTATNILISQSVGNKKYLRIQNYYIYQNRLMFVWGLFLFLSSFFSGYFIAHLFFESEVAINYFIDSWVIFNITFLFWWIIANINGLLTSIGLPKIALRVNFARISLGIVTFPLLGHYFFGWEGIIWGIPIGTLFASIFSYWLLTKHKKRSNFEIKGFL